MRNVGSSCTIEVRDRVDQGRLMSPPSGPVRVLPVRLLLRCASVLRATPIIVLFDRGLRPARGDLQPILAPALVLHALLLQRAQEIENRKRDAPGLPPTSPDRHAPRRSVV